ncbi:MAG TPA: heavy-metal-associated domain-containing protein [Bacteriovoracaceae bacterium]|nr:heavy-metal-associated domain-containing protein [Bacteriovoracaceae bacterium]
MKIATIILAFCLSGAVLAARVELEVNGMTCGMCVESITKELKTTEKAENIHVSLENKKANFHIVKGKKFNDAEIKAAIKKAGYEVGKITRSK